MARVVSGDPKTPEDVKRITDAEYIAWQRRRAAGVVEKEIKAGKRPRKPFDWSSLEPKDKP